MRGIKEGNKRKRVGSESFETRDGKYIRRKGWRKNYGARSRGEEGL